MPGPGAPDFSFNDTDGETLRKAWGLTDARVVEEKVGAFHGVKATNPKDAIASDKTPLHLVPGSFKAYTALALAEGMMKYGAWNWRAAGVRASVYVSALQRHIDKWWNGEEFDPETGVPHLANAAACLAVLIDSKTQQNMTDDRPPRQHGFPGLVNKEVPAAVAKLRDTFGHHDPKHWTILDDGTEHY